MVMDLDWSCDGCVKVERDGSVLNKQVCANMVLATGVPVPAL